VTGYEHAHKKSRVSEPETEHEEEKQSWVMPEVVAMAQIKTQELLKRRESLLEDTTLKLQRLYEVCMAQLTEMAGLRSSECEVLVQSM